MRKVLPLATVLAIAGGFVLPSVSGAQAPTQDSVTLSGTATVPGGPFTLSTLNATSGPSGENPSGEVGFSFFSSTIRGPVTCLAVSGNTATIRFDDQTFLFTNQKIQVVDGQPDTFFVLATGGSPTDCSPGTGSFGGSVAGGDITVVDAPPLPTSTADCKDGGWRNFPGFKNQGDCVSFVAAGGRNQDAG